MPLTPSQQEAVNSAREPLFIQAGAGTGKTFTLTKRIAHGLSEQSGPLIGSVDRLLTITFTNKAAGELIGRVRAELRAQGLSEEALQIDAAWISTIHSMCRRILLAHAFEVGVDPGANLLTEEETSALSALALDALLMEKADDPRLLSLFEGFGVSGATKLISDMSSLLELSPDGAAGFDLGPTPAPAAAGRQMVINLLDAYQRAVAELEAAGIPLGKKTYKENYEGMLGSIEEMDTWIAEYGDDASWALVEAFLQELKPPKGGSFAQAFKDIFNDCKQRTLDARATAQCAHAHEQLGYIVELSLEHLVKHQGLKQAKGALDTNDLLIATYRLLARDPSVAASYRGAFDSVMVDEFQDTDSLQVGIVRHVCDEDLSTLATVGDAQQSIYGFRGADLEVYQDMRTLMQEHGSKEVELATNYRSQADILRFVEDIFSKESFFGSGFLKVGSGRGQDSDPEWLHADDPRVKILLSAGNKAPQGSGRTAVSQLRESDARVLADEFERLHDQGAAYGDMAILMQSTKLNRSGAYLRELRKRGIPCIVVGGSDFYALPEVASIVMLLRVLADRDDDEALFELLGSDVFCIGDDDLLELSIATRQRLRLGPEEARSKASLFDALRYCVENDDIHVSAQLASALEVMERALSASRQESLAQVVRGVAVQSGWVDTLRSKNVEGGAVYANIERMCDMLDDFESLNGRTLFAASQYFRDMVDMAAEGSGARVKPGTLVSSGSDAVRIMTIHSSKGLEFPIVAVAEFEKSSRGSGASLISLTEGGKRYLALSVSGSDGAEAPASFAAAQDSVAFQAYACQLNKERDAEELQRLFYVALTRARDTLIVVAHDATFASKGELASGLTGDFMHAVFGEELPREHTVARTQAGALVELRVHDVPYEAQQDGAGQEDVNHENDTSLVVKHALPLVKDTPKVSSAHIVSEGIYSYSSISKRKKNGVQLAQPVASTIRLRDRSQDTDTVSPVGSAFHLVAQWLAIAPRTHQVEIEHHLLSAAHRYALDEEGKMRLVNAIAAWVSSERYAQTRTYANRYAEYAFCVDVEGIPLEGYIDLLCLDAKGGALVIDYKTGTSGQGDDLHERYALQARCYAYALLYSGLCEQVEMAFVRPEAGMEEVTFNFAKDDIPMLAKGILSS